MSARKRRQPRAALCCFGLSAALLLWSQILYRRTTVEPLAVAFAKAGVSVHGSFVANYSGVHHIVVEFMTDRRPDVWKCAFGVQSHVDEKCKELNESTSVEWELASDGVVIAEGVATGSRRSAASGADFARSAVAEYDAIMGVAYEVRAVLNGPERMIEEAQPRLKIVLPAGVVKRETFAPSLMTLLAVICGGLGVVLLLMRRGTRPLHD